MVTDVNEQSSIIFVKMQLRNIFRLVFLLVAVLLLVYVNKKTNDTTLSVAEFKVKMFQKMQADSLNSKQKLETLMDDTEKFIDNSSRVRKGIHYLTLLLALVVVVEVVFVMLGKTIYKRP
jgi:hypothetical protein